MTRSAGATLRLIGLIALLALSGCGTVYIQGPPGTRTRLMDEEETASVTHEYKVWFALYGNEPLSENDMAVLIEELGLQEARFILEATFWDSVISTFTGIFTISRQTVIIEGNR